jgi:hypothetical protein
MRLMRQSLVLLLLVPMFLLSGCGGDSEEDAVEAVLRSYIEHYLDSEPAEMYALLDAVSRRNCSQEDFVAFISRAREALGERQFEIAQIEDIVIIGDTASATVTTTVDGEAADPTQNDLIKEGSDWKLKLPSISC